MEEAAGWPMEGGRGHLQCRYAAAGACFKGRTAHTHEGVTFESEAGEIPFAKATIADGLPEPVVFNNSIEAAELFLRSERAVAGVKATRQKGRVLREHLGR